MKWALGALVVFTASAGMIAAILGVRRRAPEGGYFKDGDRASGVFGVLATGFALLLGFVIFLAFTKYDESRAGAEGEARPGPPDGPASSRQDSRFCWGSSSSWLSQSMTSPGQEGKPKRSPLSSCSR